MDITVSITKLRCPLLQQLAVSGGSQILTSGEQTFASLKRKLEGKCLWHFLEQWRYNHENPVVAVTCRGATCGSNNITEPKAYVTGNAIVKSIFVCKLPLEI